MKKKLALLLSIVLVLAAMVGMFVLNSSADTAFVDANTSAKALWNAVPADKLATTVKIGGTAITAGSGNLADVNASYTGTYTFANGILTLNGNGCTVGQISNPNGALWIVLNNTNVDGGVSTSNLCKDFGTATEDGNYAPDVDMPTIISSPIDANLTLAANGVGGMITHATGTNAIRGNTSIVIMGDVGFNIGTGDAAAFADRGIYGSRADKEGDWAKTIIIANGRPSQIGKAGFVAPVPLIGTQSTGTIIFDNTAELTIRGLAHTSNGDILFYNSAKITFDATNSMCVQASAGDVVFQGTAEVVGTVLNNTAGSNYRVVHAGDELKITNNAVVTATTNVTGNGSWNAVVGGASFTMESGVLNANLTVPAVSGAAQGIISFENGSVKLNGGTINITSDSDGIGRSHAFFFKGQKTGEDVIQFNGTTIYAKSNAGMAGWGDFITTQTVSSTVEFKGGALYVDAPNTALFALRDGQGAVSFTGGTVMANVKRIFSANNDAHTVTIGADAALNIEASEKVWVANSPATLTFSDANAKYVNGYTAAANGKNLVTAAGADKAASVVEITDNNGNVSFLNLSNKAYPAGASADAAQAYLSEAGKLVINNLTAAKIEAVGSLAVEVKGDANKLGTTAATGENGIRTTGALTVFGAAGSKLQVLTNTRALFAGTGDLTVKGDVALDFDTNNEAIVAAPEAGAIILEGNAKIDISATWRCAIKVQGKNANGDGLIIRDNVDIDINCVGNVVIWFYGANTGDLEMTGGTLDITGTCYECIGARNTTETPTVVNLNFLGGTVNIDSTRDGEGGAWSYIVNYTKGNIVFENVTVNMGLTRKLDKAPMCGAINANSASVYFKSGAKVTAYAFRSTILAQNGGGIYFEDGCDVKAYGTYMTLYIQGSKATNLKMTGGNLYVEGSALPSYGYGAIHVEGGQPAEFLGGNLTVKSDKTAFYRADSTTASDDACFTFGSADKTTNITVNAGQMIRLRGYHPNLQFIGKNTTVNYNPTTGSDAILYEMNSDLDASSATNVQTNTLNIDGATLNVNVGAATPNAAIRMSYNSTDLDKNSDGTIDLSINNVATINDATLNLNGTGQVFILDSNTWATGAGSQAAVTISGNSNVTINNLNNYHGIEVRSRIANDFVISGKSKVTVNTGLNGKVAERCAIDTALNLIIKDEASLTVNATAKGVEVVNVGGALSVEDSAALSITAKTATDGDLSAKNALKVGKDATFTDNSVLTIDTTNHIIAAGGNLTFEGASATLDSKGNGDNSGIVAGTDKDLIIDCKFDVNTKLGKSAKGNYMINTSMSGSGDVIFKSGADARIYGGTCIIFNGNSAAKTSKVLFEDGSKTYVYASAGWGGAIRNQNAQGGIVMDGGELTIEGKYNGIALDGATAGDLVINEGAKLTINVPATAVECKTETSNKTTAPYNKSANNPGSSVIVNGGSVDLTGKIGIALYNKDGEVIFNKAVDSKVTSAQDTAIYFYNYTWNYSDTALSTHTGTVVNPNGALTIQDSELVIDGLNYGVYSQYGDVFVLGNDTDLVVKSTRMGIYLPRENVAAFADGAQVDVDIDLKQNAWTQAITAASVVVDGADTYVDIDIIGSSASPTIGIIANTGTGDADFLDGTVDITIENAGTSGDRRNHALFFKNTGSINFAGTDFNISMKLGAADGNLAGMITTQDITTPINITDGVLNFRGDKNVFSMFKLRANGGAVNITGGTITGSAKSFFDTQSGLASNGKDKTSFYDQVLTIGPDAKIDFFSYGNTHYMGQFNADNQTYYNTYIDEGVTYLTGCAMANNGKFLTTANVTKDNAATQLSVTNNAGAVFNLYIDANDNNRIFYGENGDPAIILNAAGNVTMIDSIDAKTIATNGDVTIDVRGENVMETISGNSITSQGLITLKGDGSVDMLSNAYVLYSFSGITIKEEVKANVVSTAGCGIHVGRLDPACAIRITDDAEVTVTSAGGAGNAIYIPGINASVTIDGNAKVDLAADNAGIYAKNDTPDNASGSATINVGGNAQVTADAKYGMLVEGGVCAINIYDNAVVDLPNNSQGLRATGVNASVNISDNAEVVIDTPAGDGIGVCSSVLSKVKGVAQGAALNVSGNAKLDIIDAASCGTRINITAQDDSKTVVPGDVAFTATDNAQVNISSAGQSIYLYSATEGSSATFTQTDAACVAVENQHPTGQYGQAIYMYSPDNDVTITSTGTLDVIGKAAHWNGAFYTRSAAKGTTDILIKDTKVTVKNISDCKITTEEIKDWVADVSNAMNVEGNGVFEITGNAVFEAYAEKNGEEFANRAHGMFIHEGMTLIVSGNAKATFTGAGDSKASTGAGIHTKGADIMVTDKAMLRCVAQGTAVAGITFESDANLTVDGYGWVDCQGKVEGASGIRSYNSSTKSKVTVEEGGLVTLTGDPAYKKSSTRITISATGAIAGKDKASAVDVAPDKLTGKDAYVRLNGVNPNTSDFVVTSVAIVAVVVAVLAAAVVVIVRRRKVQED